MFNVLPDDKKKMIGREYRLRFAVIFLCTGIIMLIAGSALLLPSIIIANQNINDAKKDLERVTKENEMTAKDKLPTSVRSLVEEIRVLNGIDRTHKLSELIARVIESRDSGIVITSFSHQLVGTSSAFVIQGKAKTRDDLIKLSKTLEKTEPFTSADFPVDLIGKSRDITFTMTLHGKF